MYELTSLDSRLSRKMWMLFTQAVCSPRDSVPPSSHLLSRAFLGQVTTPARPCFIKYVDILLRLLLLKQQENEENNLWIYSNQVSFKKKKFLLPASGMEVGVSLPEGEFECARVNPIPVCKLMVLGSLAHTRTHPQGKSPPLL